MQRQLLTPHPCSLKGQALPPLSALPRSCFPIGLLAVPLALRKAPPFRDVLPSELSPMRALTSSSPPPDDRNMPVQELANWKSNLPFQTFPEPQPRPSAFSPCHLSKSRQGIAEQRVQDSSGRVGRLVEVCSPLRLRAQGQDRWRRE